MPEISSIESIDKEGFYYVYLNDTYKIFEVDGKRTNQLCVEANNEDESLQIVKDRIHNKDLLVVTDEVYEDTYKTDTVDDRPLQRGDFAGYKTGEHEQDLTYVVILDMGSVITGKTTKAYDPWFDVYIEFPSTSTLWRMTTKEMEMTVNHNKYNMVKAGDLMIDVSPKCLALPIEDIKFKKLK